MLNDKLLYHFVERYKRSNIRKIMRSLINADSMGAQSAH